MICHKKTSQDYLLAGHSVKPWLVALSAVATNSSGYMFVGLIGYTYAVGLSAIWMAVGWVCGDFLASLFIHKHLRAATEKQNVFSFAGVLSRWNGTNYKTLRFIGGIITIAFLGTYAAAQLSASSKALHVLFDWDYWVGSVIGAGVVVLFCMSGGLRASIWADAAQSFVMFTAMSIMVYITINQFDSISAYIDALQGVSPEYMALFPAEGLFGSVSGPILFVLGWFFAGFGVVGQPHIMVRFMAMDNPKNMNRVRYYYYGWFGSFYILCISVGLAARLLLPELGATDAELALPTLAVELLPEILVGLVIAGLFAAAISTADSQILSCSAALTCDLTNGKQVHYLVTKGATLIITAIALGIALFGDDSVFTLVMVAWSALASSFAPLLTVYALGGKPSEKTALAMMATGVAAMLLWRQAGLSDAMYEVAPGIVAGFVPYLFVRMVSKKA